MAQRCNGFPLPANVTQAVGPDGDFTSRTIAAMGPKTQPRTKEIMTSLISHLHDFIRETGLTADELMESIDFLRWAVHVNDDKPYELFAACSILGVESLMDQIAHEKVSKAGDAVTQSAIMGPFFQKDHPVREMGTSIQETAADGAETAFIYGKVLDARTGKPIAHAVIDVWLASTNGLYEQQDENQAAHNLCGKFVTGEDGEYSFYAIRPTPYPIPSLGPAGKLLQLMDKPAFRPAHIHFMVLKEGYQPITTQLYDAESKYLENDAVCAVHDSLVVNFAEHTGDSRAKLEVKYDIRMAPVDSNGGMAQL